MPKADNILSRFEVFAVMCFYLGTSNILKISIFFLLKHAFETGKDYICAHFKRINVHYYG
jgi:hypothetical protein